MIEGMFAFAVIDTVDRQLHLCRDRAGEKPLFYTQVNGVFYFASEIKAFWRNPSVCRELDPEGVIRYFAYTQLPPPYTMYKSVRRLPPGHWLTISQDRPPELRSYWTLDFSAKSGASEASLTEELDGRLSQAVEAATIGDRPLGLLLSGGIDSSLTRAMLPAEVRHDMLCYTVGNEREAEGCDDLRFAREQARASGLDHEIFRFRRSSFADAREALSTIDEPVGVYNSVISMFHSREIALRRRVVLTGSGADELFAGYNSYLDWVESDTARACRQQAPSDKFTPLAADVRTAAQVDAEALFSSELSWLGRGTDWNGDFGWLRNITEVETALDARLASELFVSMSHCASMFDTVGMASSVEYRSPFFNSALMAFAASLPDEHRVGAAGQRTTKRLLRRLAARYLPADLAWKRKTGYADCTDPIALIAGPWRNDLVEALRRNAPALGALLDIGKALTLITTFDPERGAAPDRRRIQKLALFLAWYDSHWGSLSETSRSTSGEAWPTSFAASSPRGVNAGPPDRDAGRASSAPKITSSPS